MGELTALTYVLTLGDKQRFRAEPGRGLLSGLRPRRSQSETGIHSSASPRPATSIYDPCWSSVGTTSWDREEKTRRCDVGAFTWPNGEASSHATEPSSRSHASWLSCSIASGSHKSRNVRSTLTQPEV